MLLILTSDRDLTADFLIVDLIKRELPYFRFNAEEIATAEYAFTLTKEGMTKELSVGGKTLALSQVEAVWYRRAIHPSPDASLSESENSFVTGELRHLTTGLILNPEVIWVNPIDKVFVAEHKIYQLRVAQKLGFHVPRTLVSRDVDDLRRFAASNPGGTICKPIFHGLYIDGARRYSIYTRRVDIASFDPTSISMCPVLLQEEISRSADVRATFIGSHCFVADITASEPLIDWRDPDVSVRYSASVLGERTEGMCRAMLTELGLLYGAFDFVRTPDGSLVFLEVNPTGEWAWLEDRLGFPMRDAFVELFFGSLK